MSLLNALLGAGEVEERVAIRADLLALGILEVFTVSGCTYSATKQLRQA